MRQGRFVLWYGVLCLGFWSTLHAAHGQAPAGQVVPQAAQQLLVLANQTRANAGVGALQWDDALAAAARDHCLRMAAEGQIAHRYGGEDDLSTRAGKAGAHFDLIEENVAVGPNAAEIHDEWMHSPGHRANLLNGEVNRVGIAVVAARGVFYATADYARGVQALTQRSSRSACGGPRAGERSDDSVESCPGTGRLRRKWASASRTGAAAARIHDEVAGFRFEGIAQAVDGEAGFGAIPSRGDWKLSGAGCGRPIHCVSRRGAAVLRAHAR